MAQDIQPLDTATARIHQLESAVHRLSVENARLKNILSFEAATMAGELLDAEESLNQSNRDLRSILNSMPAMIGYWDKNLCNRFGNTAYVEWFGDAGTSIAGKHIREVIGEERYQLNLPYIEAALLGERQEFERAIPSPDGKQVRYSLAQYLPDIVDGEVQGFYALVNDVSAIKHTEATLRERDEKLRGLYELSPLGIAMADMSGRFIDFNEAFRNICGYSTEELKELDYWALTPQRYAADEACTLNKSNEPVTLAPMRKNTCAKMAA
jgi:PAS domain S-box-containing protein